MRPLLRPSRATMSALDRLVLPSLEDERGKDSLHTERVVARGVFVELEPDVPRVDCRRSERPRAGRTAPLVDAALAELPQTVAAEIERRREQNQAVDVTSPCRLGRVHGDERAQAGADDRNRPAACGFEGPARVRRASA